MKKAAKFEIGKRVASESDGRITLAVEGSVAILSGQFTRKDRAPLRFKKGAGWRYSMVEGRETWRLNLGSFSPEAPVEAAPKAPAESAAEPKPESAKKTSRKSAAKTSRKSAPKPSAESAAEPSPEPDGQTSVPVGAIFVEQHSFGSYFYVVTRSNAKSVWFRRLQRKVSNEGPNGQSGTVKPIRRAYGDEFRKAYKGDPEYVGGLLLWNGKPVEWWGD